MKVLPVLLLLFAATAFIRAQNPGLLNPSEAACAEAERLGAKAFKLLPRGMFKDPKDSSKDEDNPLGVRGGGAFYSFSTGSHSYNKIPQISLEKDSSLLAGYFYGYNYSLVMDMGRVPLDAVSLEDSKIFFLSNYKSPGPISEIQSEHERLSDISRANGFMFMTWLPTTVGRTYVFRVISFDEADLLVAFQILEKLPDGSIEGAWRKLKEYPIPHPWYFTDSEMREKLQAILAKERFLGITGEVNENEITLRGAINRDKEIALRNELHSLRSVSIKFITTEK